MLSELELTLKKLRWLDPNIPIELASHIRLDNGHLFSERIDALLPLSEYSNEQVERVKEIVRELTDLDAEDFNQIKAMAERLSYRRSLENVELGTGEIFADPRKGKIRQPASLIDVKFGQIEMDEFFKVSNGNLMFSHTIREVLVPAEEKSQAFELLLKSNFYIDKEHQPIIQE